MAKGKTATRLAKTSDLREHPDRHIIPPMRPDEWDLFLADIDTNGIKEPLEVLADGTALTVLDGYHRWRAADELGKKKVPVKDAPLGSDSPREYLIKAALLRRHLTDDQRATMATLWKDEHKKEPEIKERDEKGRILPSAPRCADGLDMGHPTRAEATKIFRVPRRKVAKATTLLNKDQELFKEVHKGDKTLTEATREAGIQDERMAPKLKRLKEIEGQGIYIGSVWDYGPRANYAGDPDFHGNCIPQVVENAILYYTEKGDLILDPMAGSGTTIDVCKKLDRRWLAFDIKSVRQDITAADARNLDKVANESVDFIFLHPPYWKLVLYTKASEKQKDSDLSRFKYTTFLQAMSEVFTECHRVLKRGKVLCLLIGDLVTKGKYVPVAVPLYNQAAALMIPIGIAIKTTEGSKSQILKGKTVWAEVAATKNLKVQHDFVMLFHKDAT